MTPLDTFFPLVRGRLPGCPEAILRDALRDTCIDFCRRTHLLASTVSVPVVVGEARIELVPDEGEVWSVAKLVRSIAALVPMNREEFEVQGYDVVSGVPNYYYFDGADQLVLGPIPDAAETLTATVVVCPSDSCLTVDDALWRFWRDVIAAGARAWVRRNYGEWVNTDLEQEDWQRFETGVYRATWRRRNGAVDAPLRVRMMGFA